MLRYDIPQKISDLSGPVHAISKRINRIISKRAHAISKILFILGSYKFLAYLECIRSYAWSKGHSDPDPSSVTTTSLRFKLEKKKFCNFCRNLKTFRRFCDFQRTIGSSRPPKSEKIKVNAYLNPILQ